jgi:hypothetical protein
LIFSAKTTANAIPHISKTMMAERILRLIATPQGLKTGQIDRIWPWNRPPVTEMKKIRKSPTDYCTPRKETEAECHSAKGQMNDKFGRLAFGSACSCLS